MTTNESTSKMECSCGYETEYRCRVHPARPAHCMVGHQGGSAVWLCHDCLALLEADPAYRHGYGDAREYAVARFLERLFVLCSGCAHDEAILEDAQRELEEFLHQVDNSVRVGFE